MAPTRYRIYGRTVTAPCSGTVTTAVDGVADIPVHTMDREHMLGNHVIIECQGVFVVLAHLAPESPLKRKCLVQALPLLLLLALSILGVTSAYAAQQACPDVDTEFSGHARAWDEYRHRIHVAGVGIALIRQGRVVWACALGQADLDTREALTLDHVFRVESISKPVTAWGVMHLVQSGALQLNDPVAMHLRSWRFPETDPQLDNISIEQVLSQTSGLPLGDVTDRHRPEAGVPDVRLSLTRNARLGKHASNTFNYSNVGFNLLEVLIEDVSGERFSDYMAQEVLRPLGLEHADFNWSAIDSDRLPVAYTLNNAPIAPYVYPGRGSGGLFATVEDIAHFAMAGMYSAQPENQSVLDEDTIRLMHTPVTNLSGVYSLVADSYGLGHFIETLSDGATSVWHGGQGYGWMSHVQWVPERGEGIVILSNSQRAWPLFARILGDWSAWLDVQPVGMARITQVIMLTWIVVGVATLVSLALLARLALRLRDHTLRWQPMAPFKSKAQAVLAICAITLFVLLIWATRQDYLFLASAAPHVIGWLAITLGVLSLTLALSAVTDPQARR